MNVRDSREMQAIQYLLGELTEAEQSRLEESFFQDVELSELLSEIENDLIDQYVRQELSPRERERFETHFLISERRREKLEFAKGWLQREKSAVAFEAAHSEKPVSWWKSMLAALSAPRPVLAYSLGAFALLFLLFGLWQWSELGRLRKQVAAIEAERDLRAGQEEELRKQAEDERERSDDLAAQNEKLEQELAELKSQADNPNTDTPDAEQPTAPAPLAFILSPGARASEAPRELVVPRSAQSVRFQLNIDPGDRYPAYQARLQTASGAAVRNWNRLNAVSAGERLAVFVTVPAKSLKEGQYELTLSGVTAPDRKEDLGYYYFNLRKQ